MLANMPPEAPLNLTQLIELIRNDSSRSSKISDIFAKSGDLLHKNILGKTLYGTSNPDYMRWILYDNQNNYIKPKSVNNVMNKNLGQGGLFHTNNAKEWALDKQGLKPLLKQQFVDRFINKIIDKTNNYTDSLIPHARKNKITPISDSISHFTLEVLYKTLLQTDIDEEGEGDLLSRYLFSYIDLNFSKPIRSLLPAFGKFKTHKEKSARFLQLVKKIYEGRAQKNYEVADIIQKLFELHPNHASDPLEQERVLSEIGTFLIAGHHTVSGALSWAIVLLATNPQVAANLDDELSSVLGGRAPERSDFSKLKYLRAFINEVMRLKPPASNISRHALKEDVVGGYLIKKNSFVLMSIFSLHRHPDYWQNPLVFNPERFINNPNGQSHEFAYMPFGNGPRSCSGVNYANLFLTVSLSIILQRLKFQLVSSDISLLNGIIYRPDNSLRVIIKEV